MQTVAVLFARADSNYKALPGGAMKEPVACNWCRWAVWRMALHCARGYQCRPGLHWCPNFEREPGADDDR